MCLKSDILYWLQVNQSLFFFFTWSSVLSRQFLVCLYLYCRCRSNYQEGGGLWSHSSVYCQYIFVPIPSQELDFHRHMLWSIFSIIWKDVVVCFVDIGGFYFHHCLIFLSINNNFIVFGLCQQGIKLMTTLTLYTPLSQILYTVVTL